MATEDQIVPVNLGQGGLDTKSDSKQVTPTSFTTLTNRVFTNPGKLVKVPGFDQLNAAVSTGGNLPTTGNQNLATFNSELVILGNSTAYTYSEAEGKWFPRGNLTPVQASTSSLVRNTYSQSQMDSVVAGNYQLFAWVDGRGGIRYLIKDTLSNSTIVPDSDLGAASTAYYPKCFMLTATKFGVFYVDGTAIKIITITTPAMTTAGPSTVASSLDTTYQPYDVVAGASFNVITYRKNTTGNIVVAKFDTSGAITSTVTSSFSKSVVGITAVIDASTNNIFIGFSARDVDGSSNQIYKFWGAVYSSALSETLVATELSSAAVTSILSSSALPPMTGYISTTNTITWFIDISQQYSSYNSNLLSTGVWKITMTTAGTLGSWLLFHDYVSLASKCFTVGSTVYLNLVHTSTIQATLFCVRASDGFVISKFFQGLAGDNVWQSGMLPAVNNPTSNIYTFATQFKNKIQVTSPTASGSADSSLSVYILYGLASASLDFSGTIPYQSQQVNGHTLITGGVTSMYDGLNIVELGFHLYPEIIFAQSVVVTDGAYFQLRYFVGSAGTKTTWTITTCNAEFISGGDYFEVSNVADANKYHVWFTKDGSGTDPAPAGSTPIQVDLIGTWDANQVGQAINTKFTASAPTGLTMSGNSANLTIQTTANGIATLRANSAATGRLSAGVYQYCFLYEWIDNQGQIHRSSPSVPVSITVGASATVSLKMNRLTLTEKHGGSSRANINIVYYRTKVNGSVFYRGSSITTPTANDVANGAYTASIYDIWSDSQIGSHELLYTNGGVVANIAPPSSTAIWKNRNRIWLYSQDTGTLWYSKSITSGVGAQFSDVFQSVTDASGAAINVISEMDDKVIFFKKNQPLLTVGDGPNDTGQGSSFLLPQPIIAPTGASDTNSVVQMPSGLMFKAPRGIGHLDRKLQFSYIGAPVESFNSATCLSAKLIPNKSQVRFLLSTNDFLIYDYERDKWSDRPVSAGTAKDAVIWKDTYTILFSNGVVWQENSAIFQDNSSNIDSTVETGWINVGGLQGYQRVKDAYFLGDYKSAHTLTISVGYNYSTSYASNDVYVFTPANQQPLQVAIKLRNQKCQALRFKIVTTGASGEANCLSGIDLNIGMKKGTFALPVAQKG
jgi:hypothetical protein